MNCCQSAILPLALRIRVESTFSEVDVHVEGPVLLHFLQVNIKQEEVFKPTYSSPLTVHLQLPVTSS